MGSQAEPRSPLRGDRKSAEKSGERELVRPGGSAADFPSGRSVNSVRRSRRSRRRHGLGLRATVTGGFAGIAVIGLLVLGNLPWGRGGDTR